MRLLRPVFLLLAACGCAGGGAQDGLHRIIARYDGKPVTWLQVAEKTMELNRKHAVEQYVFWRVIEDRKQRHGVRNTPDELRLRAERAVERIAEEKGEEGLAQHLSERKMTREEYAAHLAGTKNLDDTLALEKLAVYEILQTGGIDLRWAVFTEEEDAKVFAEYLDEDGDFDTTNDKFLRTRVKGQHQSGRTGFFPRALAPKQFDPWMLDEAFQLEKGASTDVEYARNGMYFVLQVVDKVEKREGTYAALAADVFAHVLSHPPSEDLIRRCTLRYFRECTIEHEGAAGGE
ncbi:MAG: hypothetical protein ACYTAF_00660 [Planctomycetota bacterium]|jgi:hypothetical protein